MSRFVKRMVGLGIIIGLSSPTWAGDLTIPNNFTSGTPAVAAEVNANFDAVEQEVDDNNTRINRNNSNIGVNRDNITTLTNSQAAAASVGNNLIVDITTAMTNIDSLSVSAPRPGFIIFNATGIMGLRAHSPGTRDDLGCYLADNDSSSASPSSFLTIPAQLEPFDGTFAATMAITRTVPVLNAGSVTVYLNCHIVNGGGGQDAFVQNYEINAIYVPNSM